MSWAIHSRIRVAREKPMGLHFICRAREHSQVVPTTIPRQTLKKIIKQTKKACKTEYMLKTSVHASYSAQTALNSSVKDLFCSKWAFRLKPH